MFKIIEGLYFSYIKIVVKYPVSFESLIYRMSCSRSLLTLSRLDAYNEIAQYSPPPLKLEI